MSTEFIEAIRANQDAFGLNLAEDVVERLDQYYRIVLEHNPILHLVGKCAESEFAVRHILESIYLLSLTGKNRTFVDVGTGAGLPGIPCLIVSGGLRGFLIESKPKKARFLEVALDRLELNNRCRVINRQFSEIPKPNAGVVTCRAIDKFAQKLSGLVEWSGKSTMALFAGEAVRNELERLKLDYDAFLLPKSEKRFLFIVEQYKTRRRKA